MWIERRASATADMAATPAWSDGQPWHLLVARDGCLLVVPCGGPPPRRDVFPVASAPSEIDGWALALLVGHRQGPGQVRVDSFGGTIGAAVALQELLRQRTRRGAAA
jgi:hypothetical protein